MKTISVTIKDLQILLKDRGTLFLLFLLPLLFILVFSGALSAIGKSETVNLPILAMVDLDGGTAAQTLITKLDLDGSLSVQSCSATEAQSLLDENKVVGFLTVPINFTNNVQQSSPATLVFTTGSGSDPQLIYAKLD